MTITKLPVVTDALQKSLVFRATARRVEPPWRLVRSSARILSATRLARTSFTSLKV